MTSSLLQKAAKIRRHKLDQQLAQVKNVKSKHTIISSIPDNTRIEEQWIFDTEMLALIDWFLKEKRLPKEPFYIDQAVFVGAPEKFYESLKSEIANGPNGCRARTGALHSDLEKIKKKVPQNNTSKEIVNRQQ